MTTPATRCGPASLCARPDWRITHAQTDPYSGDADRELYCYTCGGAWGDIVMHSETFDPEPPAAAELVADDTQADGASQ